MMEERKKGGRERKTEREDLGTEVKLMNEGR